MNTPNPLVPQGTFPDNRGRSHIRIAVFTILAVHIVLLGALLMAGCKKTAEVDTADRSNSNNYAPVVVPEVTNPPVVALTNPTPIVPANPPSTVVLPPPDLTPPSSAGTDHVVVKGDSFYTLSKKYNVTMRAITEANPGVDSSKLKIGQKLKIPAATVASATSLAHAAAGDSKGNGAEQTYTVKSGDNLMKIAKAYSVSLKSLRSVNALKTDQIKVGQKLKIPSKASATEPASAGTVLAPATLTATNPTP